MKKLAIFAAAVFVLSLTLSSCKSHERCPAYGKVQTQSQEVPS